MLGGIHQDLAHLCWRQRGIALDQQGCDTADLGGGDRGAGRELIGALGRRRQDIDTRSRHRNVVAAIGAREERIVGVGCGDCDHVRIGAGKERRRARAGIAGCRDQHHALLVCLLQRVAQARIGGTGKAHIDDARALRRRPIEALENVESGPFDSVGLGAEGANRQQTDPRSDAQHGAVGRDRARHAGAVRMRTLGIGGGLEAGGDRAGDVGMGGVDLGIDHRDQHAIAARQLVCRREVELLRRILIVVDGLLLVLRQLIDVVGLNAGDDPVGRADVADHVLDRGAAIDVPAVQRAAGKADADGLLPRHGVVGGNLLKDLLGHVRGNVEDHLGRHEAGLANRRQVAAGPQLRRAHAGG